MPGTWSYLNCDLKGDLDVQLDLLADRLDRDRRMYLQIVGRDEIRSGIDHGNWKRRFAPRYYNHDRPRVPMGVRNMCGGIKRKQQQANTFGGSRDEIRVKVEPKPENFKKKANETDHADPQSPPSKRPRISFIKTEYRR